MDTPSWTVSQGPAGASPTETVPPRPDATANRPPPPPPRRTGLFLLILLVVSVEGFIIQPMRTCGAALPCPNR